MTTTERKIDKLIYLDDYHAELLNALHLSLRASHSRVAQFCLDHFFDIESHIKPYRKSSQRQKVMNIFIPFQSMSQRRTAERKARDEFNNFTGIVKTAIRKTMEDVREGRLDRNHPMMQKYFNEQTEDSVLPDKKLASRLLADKHKIASKITVLTNQENTL
ncbi:hypothetical protein [Paraburkholderia fungorum]|uniref:hypothetical protein n=1 Tax=Paraburkholderia fungorum TaxID=134537 RepID=UPI000D063AAF|nr:hypothetical protein [Paraburkholderia fungorum]PRZ50683.1 hypothetical protein BX589_124121 [Paraburkholderia fungorum]